MSRKYFSYDETYWTIDIEADDLSPRKIWCCVAQNVERGNKISFTDAEDFREFAHGKVFVGHNILSFDVPALRRLWGVDISDADCVDTLVLSYLWYPQNPDGHSLDAWARVLDPKTPKLDFHDWSRFTSEMLRYCERDVEITTRLYLHLCDVMGRQGFSELSVWIEHQTRAIINEQQRRGFFFDVASATALRDTLRAREAQLTETIHEVFPPELVVQNTYDYRLKADGQPYASYIRHVEQYPKIQFNRAGTKYRVFDWEPFNIGSPKQRAERLIKVGWKPKTFTPTGAPKVDEESLVAFAEASGNAAATAMAEWLVCNGRANMITTWLNEVQNDSRIHGRVFSCGAGTRRMRHTQPNTANIPSVDAKYGVECRSLWGVPGSDRRLVGCDAAGLEGRVLVHYLGNPAAAAYFLEGDPHQSNADAVGYERRPTKNLFYAFMYGASNKKLGSMVGKGHAEGERIRNALKRAVPGLDALVAKIEQEYKANDGWLETIDGGYVRCPSPHAALNYKLQSAGGILMKRAQIVATECLVAYDAFPVANIHDEWQYECEARVAHQVGGILIQSIQEAGRLLKFNIEMDGAYSVGNNWAETH
jgi:DNA polymerase I